MGGEKGGPAAVDRAGVKNGFKIIRNTLGRSRAAALSSSVHTLQINAMKVIRPVLSILRNKYLVATIAFAVWMLFFDKNDFFEQHERRQYLYKLQESKEYFTKEIEKERKFSQELKNNPAFIEKIAREKYLMKRDNEDLFIIEPAAEK